MGFVLAIEYGMTVVIYHLPFCNQVRVCPLNAQQANKTDTKLFQWRKIGYLLVGHYPREWGANALKSLIAPKWGFFKDKIWGGGLLRKVDAIDWRPMRSMPAGALRPLHLVLQGSFPSQEIWNLKKKSVFCRGSH